MKNFHCVIGANFGDEGKGLVTDWLAAQKANALVVLHNGGCQRGHTVTTPDGKRHVFRHFGAGTFTGAATWISKEFVVNPIIYREEYKQLEDLGIIPKVYIDPRCKITTPYDMLINQVIEYDRGLDKKHGSCGMGVYETLRRNQNGISFKDIDAIKKYYPDAMTVKEFKGMRLPSKLNFLEHIRNDYTRRRLDELGIKKMDGIYEMALRSFDMMANYIDDFEFMMKTAEITDEAVIGLYNDIIFEGGQGLLLDQHNEEYFPHLTPSNTGLDNPIDIIDDYFDDHSIIDTYFVTRTYMTRHGVGRLDYEVAKSIINADMQDATNVPNPFQDNLRYGLLDVDDLNKRTDREMEKTRTGKAAKYIWSQPRLFVTHINEYDNQKLMRFATFTSAIQTREGVK